MFNAKVRISFVLIWDGALWRTESVHQEKMQYNFL